MRSTSENPPLGISLQAPKDGPQYSPMLQNRSCEPAGFLAPQLNPLVTLTLQSDPKEVENFEAKGGAWTTRRVGEGPRRLIRKEMWEGSGGG